MIHNVYKRLDEMLHKQCSEQVIKYFVNIYNIFIILQESENVI